MCVFEQNSDQMSWNACSNAKSLLWPRRNLGQVSNMLWFVMGGWFAKLFNSLFLLLQWARKSLPPTTTPPRFFFPATNLSVVTRNTRSCSKFPQSGSDRVKIEIMVFKNTLCFDSEKYITKWRSSLLQALTFNCPTSLLCYTSRRKTDKVLWDFF